MRVVGSVRGRDPRVRRFDTIRRRDGKRRTVGRRGRRVVGRAFEGVAQQPSSDARSGNADRCPVTTLRASGIPVKTTLWSVYILAGLLVGLGGWMFLARFASGTSTAGNLLEQSKFKQAIVSIMHVVGEANAYIAAMEPWKLAKDETQRERLATVLYVALQIVSDVNTLLTLSYLRFSMRARISGSFSRATFITSRARGAPAVPPPMPPCCTITDTA